MNEGVSYVYVSHPVELDALTIWFSWSTVQMTATGSFSATFNFIRTIYKARDTERCSICKVLHVCTHEWSLLSRRCFMAFDRFWFPLSVTNQQLLSSWDRLQRRWRIIGACYSWHRRFHRSYVASVFPADWVEVSNGRTNRRTTLTLNMCCALSLRLRRRDIDSFTCEKPTISQMSFISCMVWTWLNVCRWSGVTGLGLCAASIVESHGHCQSPAEGEGVKEPLWERVCLRGEEGDGRHFPP